jgi:hypothetical protein
MIENTNTNVESLAKYKAISLLGRSAVDKLKDNGLVVISTNDLEKLQADLHALNAQVEVSTLSRERTQ